VASVSPANGGSLDSAVRFDNGKAVILKGVKKAWLSADIGATFYPIDMRGRDEAASALLRRFQQKGLQNYQLNVGDPTELVVIGKLFYVSPVNPNGPAYDIYFDAVEWLPDFGNVAGTATSTVSGHLVDTNALFVTNGVSIGDVVYNSTDGTQATVTAVNGETDLTLNSNIMASGEAYTVGVQSNFLLQYCFDYLILQSIVELNLFLKEDQRIPISAKLLSSTWDNVLAWNSAIYGNTRNVDLA
jgi:hypothetical protein